MKGLLSIGLLVVVLAVFGAAMLLSAPRSDSLEPDALADSGARTQVSASVSAENRFNWVALPLDNASLLMASDLAADVAGGTGLSVLSVDVWDAAAQSFTSYDAVGGSGDYALAVGGAYRIALGSGSGEVMWNIVGDVPAPDTFTYTLSETATSDYNWIMLPLDKAGLTTAAALAFDIEANADGAVDVLLVESWQPTPQGFDTYNHDAPAGFPNGDFDVRIGYPYRVTVDVSSGSSVQWPVRP